MGRKGARTEEELNRPSEVADIYWAVLLELLVLTAAASLSDDETSAVKASILRDPYQWNSSDGRSGIVGMEQYLYFQGRLQRQVVHCGDFGDSSSRQNRRWSGEAAEAEAAVGQVGEGGAEVPQGPPIEHLGIPLMQPHQGGPCQGSPGAKGPPQGPLAKGGDPREQRARRAEVECVGQEPLQRSLVRLHQPLRQLLVAHHLLASAHLISQLFTTRALSSMSMRIQVCQDIKAGSPIHSTCSIQAETLGQPSLFLRSRKEIAQNTGVDFPAVRTGEGCST